MTLFSENLVRFGPMLFIGSTALLGIGCLAIRFTLSPIHRQRLGETTVAAVLVWMVLAVLPLPRLLPQSIWEINANGAKSIRSATDQEIALLLAGNLAPQTAMELSDTSFATSTELSTHADLSRPGERDDESQSTIQGIDHSTITHLSTAADGTLGQSRFLNLWNQCRLIGAMLYFAGALACCGWLAFGHLLLVGIRMRGHVPDPWLSELFQSLATKDVPTRTRLLISANCRRPISWGTIWPIVVLPTDLCRRQNEEQLRIVLLHELGHVTQGDAWGNLLLTMAFPLLYVQPLYWWLRSQVRLAAELVADERAALQIGKEFYASELIALARTATNSSNFWGVTGVVSSPSLFYRRMEMLIARETPLVNQPSRLWRLTSLSAAALTVILGAALIGARSADGQQPAGESPRVVLELNGQTPAKTPATANESLDESPHVERPLAKSDAFGDPTQTESLTPAEESPKPKPAISLGLETLRQNALSHDEGKAPEPSPRDKDEKYDRVLIRSTDNGEVEVIFESDRGKTRMTGKRFFMIGNQIKAAEDVRFEQTRKSGDSYRNQVANYLDSKVERKSATKLLSDEKNAVYDYRVLSNDEDGTVSLEKWRIVDGQPPKLMGRFAVTPDIARQIGRLTELPKREQVPILDRNQGTASDPAPRPTTESATANRVDLITLATTYADALSAVESASDRVMRQRADRKANLLRRMINVERHAINEEYARMEQLRKTGAISLRELTDLKTRSAMLKEILDLDQGPATVPASPKATKLGIEVDGNTKQPRETLDSAQPR